MEQLARFKDAARKAGADEAPGALDRAFGKLELRHKPEPGGLPSGQEDQDGRGH